MKKLVDKIIAYVDKGREAGPASTVETSLTSAKFFLKAAQLKPDDANIGTCLVFLLDAHRRAGGDIEKLIRTIDSNVTPDKPKLPFSIILSFTVEEDNDGSMEPFESSENVKFVVDQGTYDLLGDLTVAELVERVLEQYRGQILNGVRADKIKNIQYSTINETSTDGAGRPADDIAS